MATRTYFTIDAGGVGREKATTITSSDAGNLEPKTTWAAASDVVPRRALHLGFGITPDRARNLSTFQRQSSMDNVIPPWSIEMWNSELQPVGRLRCAVSDENPVRFG